MYSGVKGGRYTNVGISKAEKFSFSSRNPKLGFSANDTNMIIGGHSNISNGNGGLSIHGKHIGLLIHSDQISGSSEHKQILKIYTKNPEVILMLCFLKLNSLTNPCILEAKMDLLL